MAKDKKPRFEMLKVFDCQDMPEDVKRAFFDMKEMAGNDCYVSWWIHDERYPPEEEMDSYYREHKRKKDLIDGWLIANGADPAPSEDDSGERVLVKHWW